MNENLRDHIAAALRTVAIHLGPNAIDQARRGEAIHLSGREADDVVDAAVAALAAAPTTPAQRSPTAADADLLRRAAARARDAARAATPGPWRAVPNVLIGGHAVARHGDPEGFYLGTFTADADATHIALWQPGVALMIAELLACASEMDPSERETSALDRCGNCGADHLATITHALLGGAKTETPGGTDD